MFCVLQPFQSGTTGRHGTLAYQDSTNGIVGGSLGWKSRGSLDPKFEQVAFNLEASSTGNPKYGEAKTGFGYHIIMVRLCTHPASLHKSFSNVAFSRSRVESSTRVHGSWTGWERVDVEVLLYATNHNLDNIKHHKRNCCPTFFLFCGR